MIAGEVRHPELHHARLAVARGQTEELLQAQYQIGAGGDGHAPTPLPERGAQGRKAVGRGAG
jgi:hypothetical protein